jgi:hypothetical protein
MRFHRVTTTVLSASAIGLSVSSAAAISPCKDGFYLAVRSDFSDLSPFLCDGASSQYAQGALLSETYNALTKQNSASIDGLVAAAYQVSGNAPIAGLVAGGFVQADGTYQFQPTATQARTSDTLTEGGFIQYGGSNIFLEPKIQAVDLFRLRAGETEATVGYDAATVVGEWLPLYAFNATYAFGYARPLGPLLYIFAPEVMVQYDHFLNGLSKPALFSSNNDALRVGPQVVLTTWLPAPAGMPPTLADVINKTTAILTFHESWDAYTSKNYRWVLASLNYTVPAPNKTGSFGVTLSYGYGNSEITGALTSQAKIGFTYKY